MSMKKKEAGKYNNMKLLMGIGLCVLVVGVFLFGRIVISKSSNDEIGLGPDVNCSVNAQFFGYYEGERVALPVMLAPWKIGSVVVDALGVDVSWVTSGMNVKWETLSVTGTLKLYILDYAGNVREEITSNVGVSLAITRSGIGAKADTISYTLPLIDLLNGVSSSYKDADTEYWSVKGVITLSGGVEDDFGFPQGDTTGEMSAIWNIYEAAGDFSMDGDIS